MYGPGGAFDHSAAAATAIRPEVAALEDTSSLFVGALGSTPRDCLFVGGLHGEALRLTLTHSSDEDDRQRGGRRAGQNMSQGSLTYPIALADSSGEGANIEGGGRAGQNMNMRVGH